MSYDWYKLANIAEFEASGLPSKEVTLDLEGIGVRDILITHGNSIGVMYDGIFLIANFNENNPFEFEDHAVFLSENDDIWLGISNES
jgi:hypothetical protein